MMFVKNNTKEQTIYVKYDLKGVLQPCKMSMIELFTQMIYG